jgi:hypothetical protein
MICVLSLKAGSWNVVGMCLIVLAYERAMERTPESEADKAAPIVPDERENTAKKWSISPCGVQNEKGDPYKMCSARS